MNPMPDDQKPPAKQLKIKEINTKRQNAIRQQRSFFGFKADIVVDQGTDLIRDGVRTVADIGDSLVCDGLIPLWAKGATRAPSMPIKPTTCRRGVRPWPKPASVQGSCTAVIRSGDHPPGSRA